MEHPTRQCTLYEDIDLVRHAACETERKLVRCREVHGSKNVKRAAMPPREPKEIAAKAKPKAKPDKEAKPLTVAQK